MGISDVDERGMDGAVDAAVLGRAPELERIREFLDRLTRGPAALIIHGDMGIGKSALLRAALLIAAVAGVRVLLADPETPELALPFAGLIDLVDPVLDAAAELLPEPQLRALQIAVLRQAPGPAPVESLAVAVGLLGLVRSLARRSPVLIAIDDAQWLDPPSAAALRFMTRRLRDEPVGFIVTQRADATAQPPPFLPSPSALDLASIALGPLSDDAVTAVLRSLPGPELSARQVRQVVRAAAGNPYFALELRRTAARDSVRQGEPLVEVPGTLLAALEQRLAAFDDDVLAALLLVAALANPRVSLVRRALGPRDPALLDRALADGVLVRSGERLRFAHPLLRSVAYHRAPESERAALHRRLAVVVDDPVERAWHLVAGHQQPDPRTARRIASGAGIALGRGAPGEAAELYLAAVARLPVRVHRGRTSWTEAAAACFAEAGDHGRAEQLLEELIVSTLPGPVRADQMRRLAALRYRREDPPAAIEILERARPEAVADPAVASAIEQQLALTLTMLGRLGAAADHAQQALELARASGNAGAEAEALAFVVIIGFIRGRGLDTRPAGPGHRARGTGHAAPDRVAPEHDQGAHPRLDGTARGRPGPARASPCRGPGKRGRGFDPVPPVRALPGRARDRPLGCRDGPGRCGPPISRRDGRAHERPAPIGRGADRRERRASRGCRRAVRGRVGDGHDPPIRARASRRTPACSGSRP